MPAAPGRSPPQKLWEGNPVSGGPLPLNTPRLVSHHPFPGILTRGQPSWNQHLASPIPWTRTNLPSECMSRVKWQGNSEGTTTSCQALQRLTQVAGPSQEDLL